MPQNKNFQQRITILDSCFASPTGMYTLDKLQTVISEKLDKHVSRRTLQDDISHILSIIHEDQSSTYDLERFPVFIKGLKDGKKKVFRYSNLDYALGNHLLSKSDQEQLQDTLSILSRYRNREEFSWLDDLFPRIEAAFDLVHEDYNGWISYQNNRDYSGQLLLGKLYNQLIQKKVIHVQYKPFESESYQRTLHPYHLKQYNNRWFLFGYEEGTRFKGITNLALDRIESFSETIISVSPDITNWGDYFDDIIGVSRPEGKKATTIVLRFTKKTIPYVMTKPIHGATQRLDKSDSEKRTITIELIPNREFYQLLFSFGKEVEVIAPLEIRNQFKKEVVTMLSQYS